MRHRLTLVIGTDRKPLAPWRATAEEALQDAIRLGKASWDRSRREHYIAVPFDIERDARGEVD